MSQILGPFNRTTYLNKINRKTVDFVLYDRQFSPVVVIELDDSFYENLFRKQRDNFVGRAIERVGLKIVHIKKQLIPIIQKKLADLFYYNLVNFYIILVKFPPIVSLTILGKIFKIIKNSIQKNKLWKKKNI